MKQSYLPDFLLQSDENLQQTTFLQQGILFTYQISILTAIQMNLLYSYVPNKKETLQCINVHLYYKCRGKHESILFV